ncbi:hypothetical protein E2I00_008899, partial [Balaenoptera physalus]
IWLGKVSQSTEGRAPGIRICSPSWRRPPPPTTMSPGEKLDPLPDTFILQPPVFHPVVPYVTTIFGGLRAGKMVMLQGAVPLNARSRVPHVTVLRGIWGDGAQSPVSVNGQHFLHYRYRLPLSRVDTLGIYGDILVTAVGFLNISPFVEGGSEYPVGHGLWPGQVIIVRGLVLPEPKDFTLSLLDEAAHVPVTLRASFADRTLAWVSRWGRKKLILAPFLFYPQRFFEVLLLCQEGELKLALSGQGVGATSLGQQALERLRELRISGSVQLYCVHY